MSGADLLTFCVIPEKSQPVETLIVALELEWIAQVIYYGRHKGATGFPLKQLLFFIVNAFQGSDHFALFITWHRFILHYLHFLHTLIVLNFIASSSFHLLKFSFTIWPLQMFIYNMLFPINVQTLGLIH